MSKHHLLMVLPIFAYLIGSIPFGRLFASLIGIDITRFGSGNIGATNVRRAGGNFWGGLTLAADALKGAAPVWLAEQSATAGSSSTASIVWISATALMAVLGHMYPIYTGFRNGGKGVATAVGVFAVLSPLSLLCSLAAFVAALVVSKKVSLGSLTAAGTLPVFTGYWNIRWLPLALVLALLIFYRHIPNIRRLKNGSEPSL
uniref:Glycerol-3-phosphate acyltransferase n=1 Tax=Desulfatirhabdium butyrativorans TaxID=340467 RepID=A0A7C4RU46_9BACT